MSFSLLYPEPQPFVVNLCIRMNPEKAGAGMRAQVEECLSCMHQDFSSITITADATTIDTSNFSPELCALIPVQEDTDRWKLEGHW